MRLGIWVGVWASVAMAQTNSQTSVNLTVQVGSPGIAVPARFAGFSYETSSLTSPTLFYGGNLGLQRMIMQAGPGVLRFGGNSDDKTGWTRTPRTSATGTGTITSDDVDRLFAFAAATGDSMLFSLNLGSYNPSVAADEAAYVSGAATVPLQFEIGNEPDLYRTNGLRTASYAFTDYLGEWKNNAAAVTGMVPAAVLTGPATSGNVTTWTVPFAQQTKGQIALLTQHLYPLAPLSAVASTASNAASIAHLLAGSLITSAVSTAKTLGSAAQAAGIPWRMAETNSVYNGGQTGVSDVFASALWGADYMFALASNGAAGVNFHGSNTSTYTPITLTNGLYSARPLYYGMLLYRLGAGESGGNFLPVTRGNDGLNLSVYAVQRPEGSIAVTLINKETAKDAVVSINGLSGFGFLWRLTAPAIDATGGITLAGASVAPGGIWEPAIQSAEGMCSSSDPITIPAASAAVVFLGGNPLIVRDAAAGGDVLTAGGIASAYSLPTAACRVGDLTPQIAEGVAISVRDSAGQVRQGKLFANNEGQVNFQIPPGTANGVATVTTSNFSTGVLIASVAPAIFTADGSGGGLPAGTLTSGPLTSSPIDVSGGAVYLTLYGTGIRGAAQSSVTCTIGKTTAQVTYAGPQGAFDGLDQVNVQLPASLTGAGTVPLVLTVAGRVSNAVSLTF